MRRIVFASNNEGKWLELVEDFKKEGIDLVMHSEHMDLQEDEQTLVSNSLSKARSAAKITAEMSLGDDSGVFVIDLDYFPGVHSRRWIGQEKEDKLRCEELLKIMEDVEKRDVYLISRFVLVDKDGKKLFSTAVKNKFILSREIIGENGFGYDPILIVPEIGKTMGELSQEEKNKYANRGRIAKEIREFLDSMEDSDAV